MPKILPIIAKIPRKPETKPPPHCATPHRNQGHPQTPRERSPPETFPPPQPAPDPPTSNPPRQPWQPQGISLCHNPKLQQLSCKKELKLSLLGNYFSNPFTELEIWYLKNFKFVLGGFLERQSKF